MERMEQMRDRKVQREINILKWGERDRKMER